MKQISKKKSKIIQFWRQKFNYDPSEVIDEVSSYDKGVSEYVFSGMELCYEYFLRNKSPSIPPLLIPDFEFPEGIGEEYRELADAFEREIIQLIETVPFEYKISRPKEISLELAVSFLSKHVAVLPLLPTFYLTPRRLQQGWGVISFAEQRDFGMVFSDSNKRLNEVLSSRKLQKAKVGISEATEAYRLKGTPNLLAEIASKTSSSGGFIYSREGYIQNEILFETLSINSDRNSLVQFASLWKSGSFVDESQCPIFPHCTPGGKILANTNRYKDSILVFDIGNVDVVISTIRLLRKSEWEHGYTVCKVEHKVDIPVGLGYSHLCLPYLMYKKEGCDSNIELLRRAALKAFFIDAPAHWQEHYSNHGMKFSQMTEIEIRKGREQRIRGTKREKIMHQSTFISYGGPDKNFAEKLDIALRSRGVDTWFFPDKAVPGEKLHRIMREGINNYQRVIVICSEQSLDRSGVLNELEKALEREASEGGTQIIIPLIIDEYLFNHWSPSDEGKRTELMNRVVSDFRGVLPGTDEFDEKVDRILDALKC